MQALSFAIPRASLLAAAIVAALTLPSLAAAQSHSADPAPPELDRIVVVGLSPSGPLVFQTDPKLPRQPVPASDGADYLKTIPGFGAIRNGGTNGDPVLRGMFGSRLNMLTNDGAMHGACPGRMDNAMSYVAPETFDHLMVTKGPQTVLWGPGGSAGTVRFIREIPEFAHAGFKSGGSVMAGNFGRRDGVLDALMGTPDLYARISGNSSRSDDYRDGSGNVVPSMWKKWNADVALGWTPAPGTLLELDMGSGNGEARYATRGMDGAQFLRASRSLRFSKTGMQGLLRGIDFNVYRNTADHVMDNYSLRDPNPMSMMPMPMAAQVWRHTNGWRAALDFAAGAFEWTLEADRQRNQHRQRSAMGRNAYRNVPWLYDASFDNNGVSGELRWNLPGERRIVGGLRHDAASVTDTRPTTRSGMMAMPNPSFGQTRQAALGSGFLRYEQTLPDQHLSWFAGVGHVERMPDYWEFFSAANGPMGSTNAFTSIRPEKTTQFDAGIDYRRNGFNAWINVYAGRIQDYILYRYGSGGMMGNSMRETNIDTTIRGGEMGLQFKPDKHWTLAGSVSQAWGANRTDHAWLPQMPPLEGRFNAGWQGERLNAGVLMRVVASQHRVANGQGNVVGRDLGPSPGFATAALNAGWKFNQRLQLMAGVDNLFNRTYSEHLNLAGSADFGFPADPVRINEPGRTLWVKLSLKQ